MKNVPLFVVFITIFLFGLVNLYAADPAPTPAAAKADTTKAPAAKAGTEKAKAPTLTPEQQAQVKTWQDRITYLKQAEDKSLNDIVQGRIEQAQIANAYKAMVTPKAEKKEGKK